MPYKDPIKRKEYLKKYRKTKKYKIYENSKYRKNYLKLYRKTEKYRLSKKKYYNSINGKIHINNAKRKYNNSIKGKEYRKKYEQSPKRILYIKKWKLTNKGRFLDFKKRLRRRAAKNNIIESYTIKDFYDKVNNINNICPYCKNKFDNAKHKLSLDHIFPISKANKEFKLTGIKRVYTIDNVQPLCLSCNAKKQDKLIF